jgi:hypothetical protein
VIPTAQASSFTLQYFPYYVWCSKYSCVIIIIIITIIIIRLIDCTIACNVKFFWHFSVILVDLTVRILDKCQDEGRYFTWFILKKFSAITISNKSVLGNNKILICGSL